MIVSSRNRRDPSIRDFTIFLGRRKKKKEFGYRVERHRAKIRDIYIYMYILRIFETKEFEKDYFLYREEGNVHPLTSNYASPLLITSDQITRLMNPIEI